MARKRTKSQRKDPAKMSYEEAIAELESINERIEHGEVGLEESLEEYKRGQQLARRCCEILDTAEQELKKIKPGKTGEGKDSAARS